MEMARLSLIPFFFSFLLDVPVSIFYQRKAYYYHYFDFGFVPKYSHFTAPGHKNQHAHHLQRRRPMYFQ